MHHSLIFNFLIANWDFDQKKETVVNIFLFTTHTQHKNLFIWNIFLR